MTKMKSRKMTKSTFAIIIMGIAMVAMLAFGGTFAYFTATSKEVSGQATTAVVKLGNGTIAIVNSHANDLVPGDVIAERVTFRNYSTTATFAVVKFSVKFDNAETASGNVLSYTTDDGWTAKTVGQDSEHAGEAVVYLVQKLDAYTGDTIPADPEHNIEASTAEYETINVCGAVTFSASVAERTTEDPVGTFSASTYMGKDVEISFQAWEIQQRNIEGVLDLENLSDADWLIIINQATNNNHVTYAPAQNP